MPSSGVIQTIWDGQNSVTFSPILGIYGIGVTDSDSIEDFWVRFFMEYDMDASYSHKAPFIAMLACANNAEIQD